LSGFAAPHARVELSGARGPFYLIKQAHNLAARTPFAKDIIMRLSARNQIKGTVVEVKKGATTSHVRVDIGNGQIVTSSITNEAVDELGIKAKGNVTVVVKASDVMIGVD
jgi:molybdopterin-binding protein